MNGRIELRFWRKERRTMKKYTHEDWALPNDDVPTDERAGTVLVYFEESFFGSFFWQSS